MFTPIATRAFTIGAWICKQIVGKFTISHRSYLLRFPKSTLKSITSTECLLGDSTAVTCTTDIYFLGTNAERRIEIQYTLILQFLLSIKSENFLLKKIFFENFFFDKWYRLIPKEWACNKCTVNNWTKVIRYNKWIRVCNMSLIKHKTILHWHDYSLEILI